MMRIMNAITAMMKINPNVWLIIGIMHNKRAKVTKRTTKYEATFFP